MSESLTVSEFQERIAGRGNACGVVVDIDETLSATNVAWFERLTAEFGTPPDGLDVPGLITKYSLAQNVPYWNAQPAAMEWMQRQRDSGDAQVGLPLVPGAVDGVRRLRSVVPVLGYLTVRPVGVATETIGWLRENGFPEVPVVSKPDDIPFADGNAWKGRVLNELVASGVTGIIDDNPNVAIHAGRGYQGTVLLFGRSSCPPGAEHAVPCETWDDVVEQASARREELHRNTRPGSGL